MTVPLVQSLIDKTDSLRLVRDQIAQILLLNSANQQELAEAIAGKEPKLWELRVFVERTDCTDEFTSHDDEDPAGSRPSPAPIVSVWFAETEYDKKRSAPTQHQQADATFSLDIYGCGVSTDTSDGHDPGDEIAANEVLRAYQLVRNILMSDVMSNLGMVGVVADHWPESFKMMGHPASDKQRVERVAVGRLELSVSFLEFAPQYEAPLLETVTGTVKRKETGELYLTTKPPLGV